VCPVSYLPNDPAGKKSTSHKQGSSAKRNQRSATRARECATRRSGSRAAAATSASGSGSRSSVATAATAAAANDDGAVLSSRSRAEARQDLLLIDTQALSSASNRAGAFTSLILRVHSSLDLVTGVLQNRSIPTDRRLGESRCSGSQHHGQHSCQQHYFLQLYLPPG
jgi:hypothetical protein